MAGVALTYTFEPLLAVSAAKIGLLASSFRSFREPLRKVVKEVIAPSFQKNFDAGGRPTSWEPLSETTMNFRAWYGIEGSQVLVRSGLLRRTIGQLNIWSFSSTTAELRDVPERIWYGRIQQSGYTNPHPTPARPFVLLQEQDYDDIEKVFRGWIDVKIGLYWAPVVGA